MKNKDRIIQISKKLDLSHIGSNLSCLPVLEAIYKEKKPEDIVILDNAHAHLAHLVVRLL
jgi:transketolase N-terminal domain/subunit